MISNNDWGFKFTATPRFGKIVESAHPYADNSNSTWDLSFPGADDVAVAFDSLSRTETNYDYVFFRNGAAV